MCTIAWLTQARRSLELKTHPRFRPVSLSLSMVKEKKSGVVLMTKLIMNFGNDVTDTFQKFISCYKVKLTQEKFD
jgi:hypothetical protein